MTVSQSNKKRPPYGILAILMAGSFIAILNSTLLNIALPSIMKDLEISPTTVQWLTTSYMLVIGVLIPTTGFLIQKYSIRHLFLVSMVLFTFGSLFAGNATEFPILLISRMFQALGAASTMPLLMNVLLTSFPIEKRGLAMGIFGLVMNFAPAIGPTLSGWVIEHYDWRMLFHMITPFAILILGLAFFMLKDNKETKDMTLDKLSVVLSSLGFGGLLYGFSSAAGSGWGSPEVYGTVLIGAVSVVIFIMRQFRLEIPMLDFRIYKYPMFSLASSISILLNISLFSAMILLPMYVQTIRGISPFYSGLLMLPGAIVMGIMSPITGRLFDKYGARVLAVTGLIITAVTTFQFSQLTLTTSYTQLMIIYTIRMFGLSMVSMPIMTNGLNQLPSRMYPHGTAMNNTLQQVSGAIGSALLVTVMSTRTATHTKEMMAAQVERMTDQPSTETLQMLKNQISLEAMKEGINDAFFVSVFILCVALFLAFFIKRSKPEWEMNTKNEKSIS